VPILGIEVKMSEFSAEALAFLDGTEAPVAEEAVASTPDEEPNESESNTEGADEAAAGEEDAKAEEPEEAREDDEKEGEEATDDDDEEEESEEDAAKPAEELSKSQRQRRARKARREALEQQVRITLEQATQREAQLAEAVKIGSSLANDLDEANARIAELEARLADAGYEEAPEAAEVRRLNAEKRAAQNAAEFDRARKEAAGRGGSREAALALYAEATQAAVLSGLSAGRADIRAILVGKKDPSMFGLPQDAPLEDIAQALARARGIDPVALEAKAAKAKRATEAKAQIAKNSKAPPPPATGAGRPPSREYGVNVKDALAFLDGT
jgi:chromosome segregation ATPase